MLEIVGDKFKITLINIVIVSLFCMYVYISKPSDYDVTMDDYKMMLLVSLWIFSLVPTVIILVDVAGKYFISNNGSFIIIAIPIGILLTFGFLLAPLIMVWYYFKFKLNSSYDIIE